MASSGWSFSFLIKGCFRSRDGNRNWKTNSNPITNRKWKRKTNNRKFRIHQSEIFIPNRKKNRKRKISENNRKIPQCSDLNRNIIGTQSEIFPLFLLFRLFRIRSELEHKGRIRTIGTNWVEIGNFYCVPICSDLFRFVPIFFRFKFSRKTLFRLEENKKSTNESEIFQQKQ